MGPRQLLWRLTQPVELGGYGYKWSEAIRLGPIQAAFIVADEETIKAMEARLMMHRMKAQGLSPEDARRQAKAYMRDLRMRYTGKAERE